MANNIYASWLKMVDKDYTSAQIIRYITDDLMQNGYPQNVANDLAVGMVKLQLVERGKK